MTNEIPTNEVPPETKIRFALNADGEETTLPASPIREDFPSDEAWEESLAGWNHRVRPLLGGRRGNQNSQPEE